jgi:hypothetical protein
MSTTPRYCRHEIAPFLFDRILPSDARKGTEHSGATVKPFRASEGKIRRTLLGGGKMPTGVVASLGRGIATLCGLGLAGEHFAFRRNGAIS